MHPARHADQLTRSCNCLQCLQRLMVASMESVQTDVAGIEFAYWIDEGPASEWFG